MSTAVERVQEFLRQWKEREGEFSGLLHCANFTGAQSLRLQVSDLKELLALIPSPEPVVDPEPDPQDDDTFRVDQSQSHNLVGVRDGRTVGTAELFESDSVATWTIYDSAGEYVQDVADADAAGLALSKMFHV